MANVFTRKSRFPRTQTLLDFKNIDVKNPPKLRILSPTRRVNPHPVGLHHQNIPSTSVRLFQLSLLIYYLSFLFVFLFSFVSFCFFFAGSRCSLENIQFNGKNKQTNCYVIQITSRYPCKCFWPVTVTQNGCAKGQILARHYISYPFFHILGT